MKFGNQLAFVDMKIVQIGFWEFLPRISMGILNVRDLGGNFAQKSAYIFMATKDLWGKNSQKAISMTFGMSNGSIITKVDLLKGRLAWPKLSDMRI